MEPKPLPDEPTVPLYLLIIWRIIDWVTWPSQARLLKREGFRHTGWRKWEYP